MHRLTSRLSLAVKQRSHEVPRGELHPPKVRFINGMRAPVVLVRGHRSDGRLRYARTCEHFKQTTESSA